MQRQESFDVFTYGSLMYAPVWTRVVRGNYPGEAATVHGFRRVCVRGRQHPALIVAGAPGAIVAGRLYRGVDAADLRRLDHFETSAYARVLVAASTGERVIPAHTYLALNTADLLIEDWSVERFEREGLPVFLATYAVQHAPPD